MTWLRQSRSVWLRRAAPLVSAGALLALGAGCGNGLQSTAAGSAVPSEASPSPTAPSSSPSSTDTASADSSASSDSASGHRADGKASHSASATATATTPSTATCSVAQLGIGVKTADGGGAAGSTYVLLTFTNQSGDTCDLYGYPGVAFVGSDGSQLGAQASRSDGSRSTVVKLAQGASTTALLQIANAGNFDPKECAPTTSQGFRVYPPAATKSVLVPFSTQACQRTGAHQLSVSPVGTTG